MQIYIENPKEDLLRSFPCGLNVLVVWCIHEHTTPRDAQRNESTCKLNVACSLEKRDGQKNKGKNDERRAIQRVAEIRLPGDRWERVLLH